MGERLSATASAGMIRQVAAVMLIAIAALAPLPLGSNRDWAWSPLALAVGAALAAFAVSTMFKPPRRTRFSLSMNVSVAAMASVLAWAMAQLLPWSEGASLTAFLSSSRAILEQPPATSIALDGERALAGILRLMTYAGVFWLAAQLSRDRHHARAISLALVVSGVLVTMYGWAVDVSVRSCTAVTVTKIQSSPSVPCPFSGTFVNSSNYADFVGLAGLICLAALQGLFLQAGASARGTRARWRARLMILSGSGALYLAALLMLVAGLIYSTSKAALASFLVAALVMTALTGALNGGRVRNIVASTLGISLVVVVALLAVGEGVLRRSLMFLTEGEPTRPQLFELAAKAIALRPWTGWGLGSFESLFGIFQPASIHLVFNKAHNTYLENALDLGIPASLLLVVAIAAPALRCARGLRERSRDTQFAAAAIGATIFMAAHSIVDFGSQIPAVAVAFSAMLGVGWAQSWSSRHSSTD